jgi:hypothetical protein
MISCVLWLAPEGCILFIVAVVAALWRCLCLGGHSMVLSLMACALLALGAGGNRLIMPRMAGAAYFPLSCTDAVIQSY